MTKPFTIGALLAVGVLTASSLWRFADTRPTSAAVVASPSSPIETSVSASTPADAMSIDALPGEARPVEISAAVAFVEGMARRLAAQPEPENGTMDEEAEAPDETATLPEGTEPAPAPPVVTEPQPLPVGRPQNQPAALPTRGVFHGFAEHMTMAPGQEQRPATQTEFWIDLETGDARILEKEAGGNNEVIRIRRGVNQTVLFSQDKRARTQVASDEQAPYLNEIRDGVLSYRMALDQGAFVILAEDLVNGQPAIRVRPQGPGPDLADLFLSRDHGLPVKEVTYQPTQSGGREEAQTRISTYRQVEILARAQVAQDLFSPSIPSDWEWVTTRTLDLASAGAFRLFDLYWLGTEYSGMNLLRMAHDEVVQSSGRLNMVAVEYGQRITDPQATTVPNQLSVVLRPPLTSEEQAARNRGGPPPGEQVTINGRRASLFVPQAPQGGSGQDVSAAQAQPTVLELPMDRSLVVLYGKDRAQVLQAARDLQKLN